ncbi:MAG: hypothetical protein LBR91_02805 [Puniceicoccales bacterium]|jgi:hypothetical protein|nr:hypothetical protein [Puniceicoccales bacterium]
MEKFLQFFQNLDQETVKNLMFGCYAICVILLCCLIGSIFKKKWILLSNNEEGSIFLTRNVLREIIEAVTTEVGITKKVCIHIKHCRSGICIEVVMRASGWKSLPNVPVLLRSKLYGILVNDMQLAAIKKVNVVVVGFARDDGSCCCPCHEKCDEKSLEKEAAQDAGLKPIVAAVPAFEDKPSTVVDGDICDEKKSSETKDDVKEDEDEACEEGFEGDDEQVDDKDKKKEKGDREWGKWR